METFINTNSCNGNEIFEEQKNSGTKILNREIIEVKVNWSAISKKLLMS